MTLYENTYFDLFLKNECLAMAMETLQASPIPMIPFTPQPYQDELKIIDDVITVQPKPSTPPPIPVTIPVSVPTPVSISSVLRDLFSIERLHITKKLRMKSVLCLRGKKNRFYVRSPDQSLVYTIDEENRWWVGYFFYGLRPLELKVCNNEGQEVMRVVRPYACTMRIFPCSLQRCSVFSPPDTLLGSIEQQWTPLKPIYVVRNTDRDIVFWVYGPAVTISCYNDIEFRITKADGTNVGATCKRWQGLLHALFFAPVSDRFGIAFDIELTVEEKGLLLATTLLIDYMYYDA